MIITLLFKAEWRESREAFALLEDREIITAMRYNFDIKNSLFDYRKKNSPRTQNTSQLFTAATQLLNDFTRQTIKKISSEINRAIHFLLQIILMLTLSPFSLLYFHSADVFEIIPRKNNAHLLWCYSEAWCW